MAASTYGTPSPRAMDPWTIENTLAPLAYKDDRSQLQSELQSYQLQRAAAEGQYGHELDAQHQYAKQQLVQQLYEAKLKEIAPIAGRPGGTQFMASMPGMEGFGSPESWANFAGAANVAQGAENYKNVGAGFKDFSEGGSLQPVQQLPGMGGIQDTLTDNARVRAELIKQQTSLARANIERAPKPVRVSVSGQGVMNADGTYSTTTYSGVPLGQEGDYRTRLDADNEARRRAREADSTTTTTGSPGASSTAQPVAPAAKAPATATAPAARPPTTSLGAKPIPPPPPGMARVDTNSANGSRAQNAFLIATDRWSKSPNPSEKAAAQNIRNNMDGTTFRVFNHPTRGPVAQGRDGQLIAIPQGAVAATQE